jgi:hypothetical protein
MTLDQSRTRSTPIARTSAVERVRSVTYAHGDIVAGDHHLLPDMSSQMRPGCSPAAWRIAPARVPVSDRAANAALDKIVQ